MFDFEGLETHDPSPESGELYQEDLQRIADGLEAAAFAERRDACRAVLDLRLGPLAAPLLPRLRQLLEADEDHEVRKAARRTIEGLQAAGVTLPDAARPLPLPLAASPQPPVAAASALRAATRAARTGRTAVARGNAAGTPAAAVGPASLGQPGARVPRAQFQVFKEVLPMRLERDSMTPAEIAEIWEKIWGVQYASRIRFSSQPDAEVRWLNPREDIVPRVPFVVNLDAGAGSILYSLAAALQLYGEMAPAEAEAERARRAALRAASGGGAAAENAGDAQGQDGSQREPRRRMRKPWREGPPLLFGLLEGAPGGSTGADGASSAEGPLGSSSCRGRPGVAAPLS